MLWIILAVVAGILVGAVAALFAVVFAIDRQIRWWEKVFKK